MALVIAKDKLLAYFKELRRLVFESVDLFLKEVDLVFVVDFDGRNQEFFEFGAFEYHAHDHVVDILVFDEFPAF